MAMRQYLRLTSDMLMVVFIPFFIVLFIEFVLRLGMGPFTEHVSLVSAIFASLVAICSFVWIKRGMILGFIPIFIASVIMLLLHGSTATLRFRFFYFFISILLLTFIAICIYAISKVSRARSVSYARTVLLFFFGVIVFVGGMGLIEFLFGFLKPDIGMLKSFLLGVRSGLLLGCGISVVVLLISQRNS
jgi:hypothetical protein